MEFQQIPIGQQISCSHRVTIEAGSQGFHLHDVYELYLFLRGDVHYFVGNTVYPLQRGDLMFFNEYEIHRAAFLSSRPYERVVIHFHPRILDGLSTEQTHLLGCFREHAPGTRNRIHLEERDLARFLHLYSQLDRAVHSSDFGQDVLVRTYLAELLVIVGAAYYERQQPEADNLLSEDTRRILEYIDRHLGEELSLERLERSFLINRFSLCRLFKEETGTTIYNHILNKRISLAKLLLAEQHSVTEVCEEVGFGDYSNFIRTFRRITGSTPLQYQKQSR